MTEREAAHARSLVEARAAARQAPPPDATPVPKDYLAPGRLELAAKFSERPRSRPMTGGVKIGIETGEGTVAAILPATVWRKLKRAAEDYPRWVAALSGSPERIAKGEIDLKHPALRMRHPWRRPIPSRA